MSKQNTELLSRLHKFKLSPNKPYWFERDYADMPGWDFTREFSKPRKDVLWPDGVVGIYVDDDFWCMAALPWEFRKLPLDKVVEVLWPEIDKPTLCPDHGSWSEWWERFHPFRSTEIFIRACIYIINDKKSNWTEPHPLKWRWGYLHRSAWNDVQRRLSKKRHRGEINATLSDKQNGQQTNDR